MRGHARGWIPGVEREGVHDVAIDAIALADDAIDAIALADDDAAVGWKQLGGLLHGHHVGVAEGGFERGALYQISLTGTCRIEGARLR